MLIIGIAGGTGSGKSTITNFLKSRFEGHVTVISHDNYYKAQHERPLEVRAKQNYDSPEAYETDLLIEHLKLLRNDLPVEAPVYDFSIHDRSDEVVKIEPNEIIILDGILVLADPKLREQMDIKIFVDTDADIRILRRIRRDIEERGRTLDSVIEQYISTVKPMHEMYVEPSKRFADIIIPEGGKNLVALQMIENSIKGRLAEW